MSNFSAVARAKLQLLVRRVGGDRPEFTALVAALLVANVYDAIETLPGIVGDGASFYTAAGCVTLVSAYIMFWFLRHTNPWVASKVGDGTTGFLSERNISKFLMSFGLFYGGLTLALNILGYGDEVEYVPYLVGGAVVASSVLWPVVAAFKKLRAAK